MPIIYMDSEATMLGILGIMGCIWITGVIVAVAAIGGAVGKGAFDYSAEQDRIKAEKEVKTMYTEANNKAENKKRAMAKYQKTKNDSDWKAFRGKLRSAFTREKIMADRARRETVKLKKESAIEARAIGLNGPRFKGSPVSS